MPGRPRLSAPGVVGCDAGIESGNSCETCVNTPSTIAPDAPAMPSSASRPSSVPMLLSHSPTPGAEPSVTGRDTPSDVGGASYASGSVGALCSDAEISTDAARTTSPSMLLTIPDSGSRPPASSTSGTSSPCSAGSSASTSCCGCVSACVAGLLLAPKKEAGVPGAATPSDAGVRTPRLSGGPVYAVPGRPAAGAPELWSAGGTLSPAPAGIAMPASSSLPPVPSWAPEDALAVTAASPSGGWPGKVDGVKSAAGSGGTAVAATSEAASTASSASVGVVGRSFSDSSPSAAVVSIDRG